MKNKRLRILIENRYDTTLLEQEEEDSLKNAMDLIASRPDSSFNEIIRMHETIDNHQTIIMDLLQNFGR